MQKSLTDAQVIDFSLQHDHIFGDELRTKHSWSRVVSLANFSNLILKLGIYEQKHVGVVSGTINEPELNFINSKKQPYYHMKKIKYSISRLIGN